MMALQYVLCRILLKRLIMSNAEDYYNKTSQEYVRKWRDIKTDRNPSFYFRRKIIQTAVDMTRIGAGQKVIEIGCGTGLVLKKILEHTRPVYGVDISHQMLERVRDSVLRDYRVEIVPTFQPIPSNSESDVFLTTGDFSHLTLPTGYFDRIMSVEVLRYIADVRPCLSAVRDIMKPDALFTFTVTNIFSSSLFPVKYKIRQALGLVKSTELHQYFVTESGIRRQLVRLGFDMVGFHRVRPISMFPLLKLLMRTPRQVQFFDHLDAIASGVPILRNLCDTFIITVKKR